MKPLRVGLLGLGVVGSGVWTVLAQNDSEIARRAGRSIEVVAVAVRDVAKARALVGDEIHITTHGQELVRNPDIDIHVEILGGDTLASRLLLQGHTKAQDNI